MRKRGPHQAPNQRCHPFTCVMCGRHDLAAHPNVKTCSNACRSALRRWRARYHCEPNRPPGLTLNEWRRSEALRLLLEEREAARKKKPAKARKKKPAKARKKKRVA